ncbi:MAG: Hsp33 family molecular chaperone HslO [Pseudomonadota bacterium]
MKQLNKDFLQGFLFDHSDVRGKIVRLNNSIHTIMEQHDYPPVIRSILGELLVASVLLSSSLKYEGQMTLQFQSESGLKMLVAKCNHRFEIRGLAQWDTSANIDELKDAFFTGQLVITLENTRDNQRYQSVVEINHQTIAEAIETYFKQSEQLPTKIILGDDAKHFAGLLVQKMPSHNTDQVDFWQHVEILTSTLKPEELIKWDNQRLLKNLFVEETIRLYDEESVSFKCTCSQEKAENTLRLLGKQEALATFSTNKTLVITCDYCNNHIEFSKQAVEQLFH